jgi:hypothetical protein
MVAVGVAVGVGCGGFAGCGGTGAVWDNANAAIVRAKSFTM